MKKRNFRLFAQTQQVYIVNPTMDTGSSVERMADGDQKLKVVHSARRMEAMSSITIRKDPSTRPILTTMKSKSKEPLGL